jgi:hypothetical protein
MNSHVHCAIPASLSLLAVTGVAVTPMRASPAGGVLNPCTNLIFAVTAMALIPFPVQLSGRRRREIRPDRERVSPRR